jgi:ankyrin repeat protein
MCREIQKVKETNNRSSVRAWIASYPMDGFDEENNLHFAAWKGDLHTLKMLFRQGEDVFRTDGYGWTTLHLAVWNTHTDVTRFLLGLTTANQKAWISMQNEDGDSALHFAVLNDDVETITELLKMHADTNSQNDEELTPLLCAAKKGNINALKALVSAGADTSVPNSEGLTPVHWAAQNGYVTAIKVLKDVGFDVSSIVGGWAPLHFAAWYGHSGAVKALKEAGADMMVRDKDGLPPMTHAAKNGYVTMVNTLIDSGYAVTERTEVDEWTPMHWAATFGNVPIIAVLYAAGADISARNKNGITPIHAAANRGHIDANLSIQNNEEQTALILAAVDGNIQIVRTLIALGVDVNVEGAAKATALSRAAQFGHKEIVRILVEAGAIIEARNTAGATALLIAAEAGHDVVIDVLVTKGADVNARNNPGTWPLQLAAASGNVKSVLRLLQGGANVNARNNTGFTPLMAAMKNPKGDECARVLLEFGADVNAKESTNGWTPLFLAVHCDDSREDNVRVLLDNKPIIDTRSTDGNTPLILTAMKGHHRIVQLLIDYGMDVNSKNKGGGTPLSNATIKGPDGEDAALLLIENRAKVKFTIKNRQSTALHHSSSSRQERVVQRLLERKLVAVDAKDGTSFTSLYFAIIRSQEAIVRLLLRNGAKQKDQGEKPKHKIVLHTAVLYKNAGIVKLLLENGGDTKRKNGSGQTAKAAAHTKGFTEIVPVFEEYESSGKGRRGLFG